MGFSSTMSMFSVLFVVAAAHYVSSFVVQDESFNSTTSGIQVVSTSRRNNHERHLRRRLRTLAEEKHQEQQDHRHEYSPEWKSLCTDENEISATLPNNLESLEELQRFVLNGHSSNGERPFLPNVYDATGSFAGAQVYEYQDFIIRPIFFESIPYTFKNQDHPKCTLVFGWLSLPASDDQKVPGVILLHGGGGTADRQWNERWAREGFASISIGLEGQTPDKSGEKVIVNGKTRERFLLTPAPGPQRYNAYADYKRPLKDQWMFHAVASSMLATTILSSEPSVLSTQVGVAGCSWGGVLVTTLLPLEHTRYAFASIGYGAANLATEGRIVEGTSPDDIAKNLEEAAGSETYLGTELYIDFPTKLHYYESFWNPASLSLSQHDFLLSQVKTPTLWISNPKDGHFSMMGQRTTIHSLHRHSPFWMCNLVSLPHSPKLLFERPEHYIFAKTVLKQQQRQQPLSRPEQQLERLTSSIEEYSSYSSHHSTSHDHHYWYDPLRIQLPGSVAKDYGILESDKSKDGIKYYSVTFRLLKPLHKVSFIYTFDKPHLTRRQPLKPRNWQEHTVPLPPTIFQHALPSELSGDSIRSQKSNMIDYTSSTKSSVATSFNTIDDPNDSSTTSSLPDFQHVVRIRQITCKGKQKASPPESSQWNHDSTDDGDDRFCFWSIVVALPPNVEAWYINVHMYNKAAHAYYHQHLKAHPQQKQHFLRQMSSTLDYIVSSPYHEIQDYFRNNTRVGHK